MSRKIPENLPPKGEFWGDGDYYQHEVKEPSEREPCYWEQRGPFGAVCRKCENEHGMSLKPGYEVKAGKIAHKKPIPF
jgi:hypothetical protein